MDVLNEAAVNIEETPLGAFGYNETNGGVDGADDEDDLEIEEIGGRRSPRTNGRGR